MKKYKTGEVIIPANANSWPHEEQAAKILAKAGYRVEFIPENNNTGTPDIYLGRTRYEIKSPKSNKANTLEHRLKDAVNRQSCNIVFSALRIKNIGDRDVIRFLKKPGPQAKTD